MAEQITTPDYWATFWLEHARSTTSENSQYQVLRTLSRRPIDQAQFQHILEDIEHKLEISPTDEILDLCCGNGLITKYLASRCRRIVGVDFVPELARQINHEGIENASVIIQDIRKVEFADHSFTKVIIYAGIQYFSFSETIVLFESVKRWLKNDGLFFLGDIPNEEKLWGFFNTTEREKAYFDSVKNNKPIIGTWFNPEWLIKLGRYTGFEDIKVLAQSPSLPYAYFRFDMSMKKLS